MRLSFLAPVNRDNTIDGGEAGKDDSRKYLQMVNPTSAEVVGSPLPDHVSLVTVEFPLAVLFDDRLL
jgi:hypothetical protein